MLISRPRRIDDPDELERDDEDLVTHVTSKSLPLEYSRLRGKDGCTRQEEDQETMPESSCM
jgi:hypothetical protein